MSDFSQVFQLLVPPGTQIADAVDFPLQLGDSVITEILLTFPPGCSGLVGAAIFAGGESAYPNQDGTFFAFDDYTYTQEVDNQIQTGQWDILAYNLDINTHTLQVVVKANNISLAPAGVMSPPISL